VILGLLVSGLDRADAADTIKLYQVHTVRSGLVVDIWG
jgi:hypothetical protein